MSTPINGIQCQDSVKNTGVCDCYFDPRNIIGLFLVPKKKTFSNSELSDLSIATTIKNAILAIKANRIFPFFGFTGATDSSEEPVSQTYGYGKSEVVREGIYKWAFNFREGGVNANNALRTFNGKQNKYSVLFIDADNVLIGTAKKDANGNTLIAGIPLDNLYTSPWKLNDGANMTAYKTMVEFEPVYINEKLAFKKVDPSLYLYKEANGLLDITIKEIATTNTTVTVQAFGDCGENLYDTYKTELAAPAAWKSANATTGGDITIASVVGNDTLKGWVITWTSGDTDLPAVGSKVNTSMVDALSLDGLGVAGYENTNVLATTRVA